MLLMLLLVPGAQPASDYHPGSYYAAHVIRDGGELVIGEWIIELSCRDTLIRRQTFEVYADPS